MKQCRLHHGRTLLLPRILIPQIVQFRGLKVRQDEPGEQDDAEEGVGYEENQIIYQCKQPCGLFTYRVPYIQEYLTNFTNHSQMRQQRHGSAASQRRVVAHERDEVVHQVLDAQGREVLVKE